MDRNSPGLLNGKNRIRSPGAQGTADAKADTFDCSWGWGGGNASPTLYPQRNGLFRASPLMALIVLSVIKLMASVEGIAVKFATLS